MTRFSIAWRTTAFSVLFGGITLIAVNVSAATPEPPGLFSTLPGMSPAVLPEQAIAGRSRAVQINHGQLRSGRFFVSLPDGVSFEAVRDLQQDLGKGRYAWVGHANGNSGSRVIIGVSGDAVAGTFAYQGRLFKLEPRANGAHVLSEVETGDPAPELDPIPVADTTSPDATGTGNAAAAADGGPVLDVLVAYTPKIESILGGASGADALIIQAVAESNQAYANSGMSPRLNLVHTVLTTYTESGNMSTDLGRLRGTSDGYMDELHALRDSYGADLVSLIEEEPQYCGIAYRMASLSAGFASSAFSVVHRTCATGYYSFAHEIGHNQGAHHNHANASGAIYPYAYGHQDPSGDFRTVMAYNCSGGCSRVDHFSNPDILFGGEYTGIVDYADNALAIDNTAATVAGFRQQAAQNPPTAPSGLTATATSHSTIQLGWEDTSADESGFDLERADDSLVFAQIASLPANTTTYLDDNLIADTLYNYRTRAWNSAGNSSYSDVAVAATDPAPAITEQVANADMPVAGNVSGTYIDTWSGDDDFYQTIQERQSGGKKNRRYGYLEHKWSFQVQSGNSVVLFADVQTTATTDSFTFAYSTDNATYIDMFAVDANNAGVQQFALPPSLNGTLYVRVRDNARQPGNTTSLSVAIDQLLIRSEIDSNMPPPNAPVDLSAAAAGTDQININWNDRSDNENGFILERRKEGTTPWNQIKTTGADANSYTDTGLQAATLYEYQVHAFNGGGASAYSSGSARTDEQLAGAIDLSATGSTVRRKQSAQLTWSGAQSTTVDIYRNGSLRATSVTNNGSYTDNIGRKGDSSYVYEVCEAGSTNCSNSVSVVF